MITGTVKVGEHEFYTQGENVENFIEMVNDAIYTVYEIPFDYIKVLSKVKSFSPKPDQLAALYNGNIQAANLHLSKSAVKQTV